MKENYFKVLMIEDSRTFAQLILEMIEDARGTEISLDHAFRLSTGVDLLKTGHYDVILLDLSLPDSIGIETLKKIKESAPEIPVVIMTSLDDEETAAKALQAGAQDYLVKGDFDTNLLVRSLKYAIERKYANDMLRESEQMLSAVFQEIPSLIAITTYKEGLFVDVNRAFETITGYSRNEILARTLLEIPLFHSESDREGFQKILKEQGFIQNMEVSFRKKSGAEVTGLLSVRRLRLKGKECLLSVFTDISERKRIEEHLRTLLELQTSGKKD
ncbi:MAG: response regulator [Ignavibacteria bacterium]|jgi:PAS domain S-box-containing protein|nr:response regulator [Ignavibacteria bacterium]MCU7504657.1 response regulator [Ignavibacteria bacterium]MCU7517535.1 response regulator [Ignavibacteria bacterium]